MNKVQDYKTKALIAQTTQHTQLSFTINATEKKVNSISKKLHKEDFLDILQETMMSVFDMINGHHMTVSLTKCDVVNNTLNATLVFSSTHYHEITSDTMIEREDFKTDIISAICEYLDIDNDNSICNFSDITKCNLTLSDIIKTCNDDFGCIIL